MLKMGFNPRWVTPIMGCVSSISFVMLVNGQPGKKISPTHGLQQGDPLSPYLFLLVSDVFLLLIQKAVELEFIEGIRLSPRPLYFLYIFCR